jgi:glycosyltransferase involved in cell wall biosynthesis
LYLGSADLRKGHGLHQFLLQAWPQIRTTVAGVRLILGGRGTEGFSNPDQSIVGLGFVPDEREFYARGLVLINPQMRGSGIKIKNIMGMFAGRAVVTTPKGAEGIRARAGEDFALAPTMAEMAQKVGHLLLNPLAAEAMGSRARARAMAEYALEPFFQRCDDLVTQFQDSARRGLA